MVLAGEDADGDDHRCENTFPGPRVAAARRRRRCSSRPTRMWQRMVPDSLVFCLLLVLLLPTTRSRVIASAQQQRDRTIGVDICGCQPAEYEFTLDFGQVCDDSTVLPDPGKGVNETACLLTDAAGRNDVPAAELVPVSIQRIQIFELDQNKVPGNQVVVNGPFADGDSFSFKSLISDSQRSATDPPRGLQLVMEGTTANGEKVINSFLITYTNDCAVFPVLTEGQQAGWVVFSDLVDPPNVVCPLSTATFAPVPTVLVSKAPVPTVPTSSAPVPTVPVPTPTVPITNRPVFPVPYAPAPAPARPTVPLPSKPSAAPVAPVPSRTLSPHCPPLRGGKGYRTEDDEISNGGGKGGGTFKKQRREHSSSDRIMQKFHHDRRRRRLTAHFNGGGGNIYSGECPEYIEHDGANDDDDDDDEGERGSSYRSDSGSSYRTDSDSHRGKASRVMKKSHKKSGMSRYRLESGSKGKGMSS